MKLSVIIACYNEEENVKLFYDAAINALKEYMEATELIFVNDGSKDNTLLELKKICDTTEFNVNTISFSRNFGKEAAILAGLKASKGELVAIIDADLQQRPEYIVSMMEILEQNPEYDAVAAYQDVRKEGKILTLFKDAFYAMINKMSEVELARSASDFRLLKRPVVEAILSLPEKCRFSKGIFSWVGFETYYMPYTVEERANGESKWSFFKLFAYAMDGIVAFSVKPLIWSSIFGILLFGIAIIMLLYIVVKTLIYGDPVAGFPTLASLILMLSGVQLLSAGILGQYIARNYIETKDRPHYIIKEKISSERENK